MEALVEKTKGLDFILSLAQEDLEGLNIDVQKAGSSLEEILGELRSRAEKKK